MAILPDIVLNLRVRVVTDDMVERGSRAMLDALGLSDARVDDQDRKITRAVLRAAILRDPAEGANT